MLKQFQQIFTLSNEINGGNLEFNKGKNVETAKMGNGNEIKTLCESSVSKAADMAAGLLHLAMGTSMSFVVVL